MPRVSIKKEAGEYVPAQLRAYVRYKGIPQNRIAEWWGCTQPNVAYKLKHGAVDAREMALLFDRSEAEPDEIVKVFKL